MLKIDFFPSMAFLSLCQGNMKWVNGWKRSDSQLDLSQIIWTGACEHCCHTNITSCRPWVEWLLLRKLIFTLPTQGESSKVRNFLNIRSKVKIALCWFSILGCKGKRWEWNATIIQKDLLIFNVSKAIKIQMTVTTFSLKMYQNRTFAYKLIYNVTSCLKNNFY